MNPILFELYGPIAIQAYGLCIAVGAALAISLFLRDKKVQDIVSTNQTITILQLIILGAYAGGRALSMVSQPAETIDYLFLFKFWEPGLSILGSIIGVTLLLPIYFYIKKIPIASFLDRVAIYAPLVQSFGRLGCFFAGCCYGMPTDTWYAVTYTHQSHMAPLHCALHPSQLYSSAILLAIFLFLYFVQQHRTNKAGILFCSYLVLTGAERFIIDFIRWDRLFFATPGLRQMFSVHQWIALSICLIATITIYIIYNRNES